MGEVNFSACVCVRYGLSEGSPSEEGTLLITMRSGSHSVRHVQGFKSMLKRLWTIC